VLASTPCLFPSSSPLLLFTRSKRYHAGLSLAAKNKRGWKTKKRLPPQYKRPLDPETDSRLLNSKTVRRTATATSSRSIFAAFFLPFSYAFLLLPSRCIDSHCLFELSWFCSALFPLGLFIVSLS
jgi:hypothetical protein